MPNNYFLIDLGETAIQRQNRIQAIRDAVPDGVTRQEARDRLHWARSADGRYALAQVNASLAERNSFPVWVTMFADVDAARAYMAANPDLWSEGYRGGENGGTTQPPPISSTPPPGEITTTSTTTTRAP